jgi:HEAT repeat protein
MAFEDADPALKAAAPLFKSKDPARRFAAAKLAIETGLPEAAALVLPLLSDPDLRLVSLAVHYIRPFPK